MTAWRDRPKQDRYAFIGLFAGMAIAAPIAVLFAYDASSMVRYVIMASGLVAGWGIGRWAGSRDTRKA